MQKLIYPDFERNILNISATFSKFLNIETEYKSLPILEDELKKNYKNIVFIIFDGLGINPLNKNLGDNSLFKRNIKQVLTSTFPSTTTNATTTLMTCLPPCKHGWFGWSLYFKEKDRVINIYMDTDNYTDESVGNGYCFSQMPYEAYYNKANSEYNINTIFPPFIKAGVSRNNQYYNSEIEMFKQLDKTCKKDGKQFTYCYFFNPDRILHDFGVTSKTAKEEIEFLQDEVEKLYNNNKDTLFVITADHGQVDIEGYIEIFKNKELYNCLRNKPFLDGRCPAFNVKKGYEKQFEKLMENYSSDLILFKSKELVDKGVFGGESEYTNKLLGDYIAVGTSTNKQIITSPSHTYFKGHHTSMTAEMEVPLILLGK